MSHPPRSNGDAAGDSFLGRWFKSWSGDAGGGAAAILTAPGFEPPTKKSVSACITIQPLPILHQKFSPLLGPVFATDKKPKVCVSV